MNSVMKNVKRANQSFVEDRNAVLSIHKVAFYIIYKTQKYSDR